MLRMFSAIAIMAICTTTVLADFDNPWMPGWTGETGYTSQFWGLHDDNGLEPTQPLAADNYSDNGYGSATVVWESSGDGLVGWSPSAIGAQPAWVDGNWGGMVQFAGGGPFNLTITVPTGSEAGALQLFLQHDWYASGAMAVTVAGATDITPATYYDYQIGVGGSSSTPWYRSTSVFELPTNPGSVDVVIKATGFAPLLDSFSVTTAVGAVPPAQMPTPEPASLALLALGVAVVLRRR